MLLNESLLIIILAGLVNGSYVAPVQYIKDRSKEMIWLHYSVIAMAIIPWLMLPFLMPQFFANYAYLPTTDLGLLILGGFLFGIGQACFAYALPLIGMALSFAINLGLSITIGSMFVVFYKFVDINVANAVVTFAVLLVLLSLGIYYLAGKDKQQPKSGGNYQLGWLLAGIAGFTSGFQNITFILVTSHASKFFSAAHSFWVWPPFLLAAAIPMALGFFARAKLKGQAIQLLKLKDFPWIIVMGLCAVGSLALYSIGMSKLGSQETVGWPAFMICIILTSQAWSLCRKEAPSHSKRGKIYTLSSVLLLVIAIILLGVFG